MAIDKAWQGLARLPKDCRCLLPRQLGHQPSRCLQAARLQIARPLLRPRERSGCSYGPHPVDFCPLRSAAASISGLAPAAPSDLHTSVVPWPRVVAFTAGAMALASLHRVTFSVLAVPFANEFKLSMPEVGALQSAVLLGYMLGQVPAGTIADQWGGANVMVVGLVLWCLATGATPAVRALHPSTLFAGLLAARAALGLAQSCIIPATSATAAKWVPEEYRSRSLTIIHSCYNFGTVAALCLTPVLIRAVGWPWALRIFAAVGLAWAAWARLAIQDVPIPANADRHGHEQSAYDSKHGKGTRPRTTWGQLVFLCWSHVVISWGFFIFQSWIPTYLHHKGMHDLGLMGSLSALPWGAAACVGLIVGNLADWLHTAKAWSLVRVRAIMQVAGSVGPAIALAPLALAEERIGITAAVACLTAAVGLQGFCYAGYHAYVQDVAPVDAGKVLGLTNSCGTVVGVLANIVAGRLAAAHNGYALLFGSMAVLYLIATFTWLALAKGEEVHFNVGAA